MCPSNHTPCNHGDGTNNSNDDDSDTRLELLFNKLDVNKDGRIDVKDLSEVLRGRGGGGGAAGEDLGGLVEGFFKKSDLDSSGDVTLTEFLDYAKKHEKKLKLIFREIDQNNDGKITVEEVVKVLKEELGVVGVDEGGVRAVLGRMSTTPTTTPLEISISWESFRDYLILTPQLESLQDILKYWRHSHSLDVGEERVIPDDFTKEEVQSGLVWRHLIAGGVAGAVSRTATAPLDRVKVFLQVHGSSSPRILPTLRAMLTEGGPLSLWRGNGINVLKIAPESAFKFMAYEQGKRFIKGRSERELRIEERFLAGSCAGAVSQSLIYPLEVVKTRLALRRTGQYRSLLHLTTTMFRTSGIATFYRGYIPNLLGILPYAGIDLAVYETLKKSYLKKTNQTSKHPNIFIVLACGTLSSACGQIASYPLALVRTRLQASSCHGDSMSGLFRNIWESEGIVGLYRGLMPNFLKVAPAVSISYVVYERLRVVLGVEMT